MRDQLDIAVSLDSLSQSKQNYRVLDDLASLKYFMSKT